MNTILLEKLYQKYNIDKLSYGKVHDKLGDVYEDFCIFVFTNKDFLSAFQNSKKIGSVEFDIFQDLLKKAEIENISDIKEITATRLVPHRQTHGNAKTDIIATITYNDGCIIMLPISSKQSYASKVAVAEFDVDTICYEVGIDNDRVRELMRKFQVAKSAKGLTSSEKIELKSLLKPYARNLVRWAITGSPEIDTSNVLFPRLIIKFKISRPKDKNSIKVDNGELHYVSHSIYTIDEYIDLTMYNKNGKIRKGGFETGLSWTYATGSGGFKIQFKA